jgi:hypothetical protein
MSAFLILLLVIGAPVVYRALFVEPHRPTPVWSPRRRHARQGW